MKNRRGDKRVKRHRKGSAVVLAGILASAIPANASVQPSENAISKLSSGALRRLLLNLRQEDDAASRGSATRVASSDHDSHVMHGSHNSFTSHGQHTSFTNQAG